MWQPCVCSSSYPKKKPALALSLEKSYLEKKQEENNLEDKSRTWILEHLVK